jgi:hypothetical protein
MAMSQARPVTTRILTVLFFALLAQMAPKGWAGSSILYGEANLIVGYSELDHWVGEKHGAQKNSVGFEYFRKVSNDFGDYLTCDLQTRLSYHPALPSDQAWALEIHNAWVEYKLGLARNIRIGHFAPAFGLEGGVDTHGTLFQTMAGEDIGFKKDWGIEYRGALGFLDYAIAAQIGSGMAVERKDGSYLASGRIGAPRGRNLEWGLSILQGETLQSIEMRTVPKPHIADQAISKHRAGADAQYLRGPFLFKGEASVGRNENDDVVGVLFETDYTVPSLQSFTVKAQGRFWTDDPSESASTVATVALGASYDLTASWALRAGVFHDLEKPGTSEGTAMFLQAYYLGG